MAGIFGTKIPASVCFAVGLLLFLLPFAELKCTSVKKKQNEVIETNFNTSFSNSGLGLALGKQWDWNFPISRGDLLQEEQKHKWGKNTERPNEYAIAALVLAAIGFLLSLLNNRIFSIINIATGTLVSVALLFMMIDLERKSGDIISRTQENEGMVGSGTDFKFVLVFTHWFYIAVICFLVASFFSYKRMQSTKQSIVP